LKSIKQFFRLLKEARFTSLRRVLKFSDYPVFIVGCGRSGTTLLHAILGAHPNIFSIPFETKIYLRTKRRKSRILNRFIFPMKFFVCLLKQDIPKNKKFWCEKTPKHVHYINEILNDFSNKVRMINIVRDCRDVILSSHPIYGENYISTERWIEDVSAGLALDSNPRVYTIRYEDLVNNFDDEIEKLLTFLDVEKIDLKNFNQQTNITEHTAWKNKVRALNSSSVGKWKFADKKVIEKAMANPLVITLLKHYNYLDE
jgi:hypothetical protein